MDNVEKDKVQDWYFTFPQRSPYKNCYIKLRGTYASTREKMNERYGNDWAFQYSREDWVFKKKDDPSKFSTKCYMMGINPVGLESISQAELYGLKQL